MSTKKSFNQMLAESEKPVLVDFYADWCGPCHAMAPVLEQYAKKHNDKLKVVKVNVDKNNEASQQYGIKSIPTLILFKKGKVIWKQAGALSLPQFEQLVTPQL